MKTLYLVRHAKSSWKNANLSDHDRPLNNRGEEDAPVMGKRLKRRRPKPELIMTSSAVRAKTTAKVLASEIGYPKSEIVVNEEMYLAGTDDLINIIRGLDDNVECVMLVGHNPTFTETANLLAQCYIDNMPTCSLAAVSFSTGSWADIKRGKGKLLDFDYPKMDQG